MQMLVFRSLDTMIDIDELSRSAFNHAFSDLGLDWHWSKACFKQLSSIAGERHRVSWYAEHRTGKRISCGFSDKICGRKDRAMRMLVDNNQARARPGILRLLKESNQAKVKSVLCTSESVLGNNIIMKARKNLQGFSALGIHDAGSGQLDSLGRGIRQIRYCGQSVGTATSISLLDSEKAYSSVFSLELQYSDQQQNLRMQNGMTARRTCISHLGDKDNPATHLAGKNILQKGVASLQSLSALGETNLLTQVA